MYKPSFELLAHEGYSNSKGMFGWLRNSLAMSVRQRNTAEELAAVRKAQAEKGEQSVFETLPEEVTVKPADVKKYTEVRMYWFLELVPSNRAWLSCSTNMRLATSRSLTGS